MAVKDHAFKEAAMGLLAPSGAHKSIDGGRSVEGEFEKMMGTGKVVTVLKEGHV